MRRTLPLIAVVAVLASCGEDGDVTTSEGPDPDQRYTAIATVLESPDHGPQLCLGGVATSLPPQCGGPDITNWDWDAVEHESMAATTWGEYTVVGTYDGSAFTLTEPAVQPDPLGHTQRSPVFPSACPEPNDGWAVVDEATATDEALDAAIGYAADQPNHAGTWVDQSINPAFADGADLSPEEIELAANVPAKLVLNVRFTGDLDRHESELRDIWGGALCVSLAEHTNAELTDIQADLHEELDGALASWVDETLGMVHVELIVDDGSIQQEMAERYGDGVVVIESALQPVE